MDRFESNPRNTQRWRILGFLALTLILSMSTWFSATAVNPQLRELWSLSSDSSAWLTNGAE